MRVKVDISLATKTLMIRYPVWVDYVPHRRLQLSPQKLRENYYAACVPETVTGDHGFYSYDNSILRVLRSGPYHWIRLSRDLPENSLTLAHELIHAQQAERFKDPKMWYAFSRSVKEKFSYRDDPIEIEARERAPGIAPLIIWRS